MKFTDGRKNRIALFLAGILAGVLCRLLTHTFEGGKYEVYHDKGFDACGILHHLKGDIYYEKTNRPASGYDPVLQFGSVQHED